MSLLRPLIAAGLLCAGSIAHAADTDTALATDGTWNPFYFGAEGSSWLNDFVFNDPGTQTFTFTLAGPALLKVTDAGLAGDMFKVYDNGALLGTTTVPGGTSADDAGVDFDLPGTDGRWSHGAWILPPGAHRIAGNVFRSPYDGGIGAVSVAAVPEPETYAMFLAGLALMGAIARRRTA